MATNGDLNSAIRHGDVDAARRVLLEGDEEVQRHLVNSYPSALNDALMLGEEEIGHLILDHAEKVYPDAFLVESTKGILGHAKCDKVPSVIKRVFRSHPANDVALLLAVHNEDSGVLIDLAQVHSLGFLLSTDAAKELLTLGCSPGVLLNDPLHYLLREWMQSAYRSNETLWKLLITHWKAEDVFQSNLLGEYIIQEQGRKLLEFVERLGMNYSSCINSRDCDIATRTMQKAMCNVDYNTVKFIIERGYDVSGEIANSGIPLLNFFILNYNRRFGLHVNDAGVLVDVAPTETEFKMFMDLLQRGANPMLKSICGQTALDCCLAKISAPIDSRAHHLGFDFSLVYKLKDYKERECFLLLARLLLVIGCRTPAKNLEIEADSGMPSYLDSCITFSDLDADNSCAPTLQNLCAIRIRAEFGSRTEALLDRVQYPRSLKDFILFRDVDLHEMFSILKERNAALRWEERFLQWDTLARLFE